MLRAGAVARAEQVRATNYTYSTFITRTVDNALTVAKFDVAELGTLGFLCHAKPAPACTIASTARGKFEGQEVSVENIGLDRMRLRVKLVMPKSTTAYVFETPMPTK